MLLTRAAMLAPMLAAAPAWACPLIIDPPSLSSARLGIAYRQPISASGGQPPYSFAVTAGALPVGLALSPSGLLGGSPTAASSTSFIVTATDATGCAASRLYVLAVERPSDLLAGEGSGPRNPPRVRSFSMDGMTALADFLAYGSAGHGVNVAAANLDGGDRGEVITAPGPGPGLAPQVRAFGQDGAAIGKINFYAYGTLRFGARVAAGLLDPDALDEIVTGAGPGAVFGPHVRGFNSDGGAAMPMPGMSFFAYGTLRSGAHVAEGDLDGGSFGELLTAPGPGPTFASDVRGFRYDGSNVTPMARVAFVAFTGTRYGAEVASGDADGDGAAEIVCGPGPGDAYGARVRGFDFDGAAVAALPGFDIMAFTTRYGLRPAVDDAAPAGGGGSDEALVAPGPDPAAPATVAGYGYDGAALSPIAPPLDAFPGAAYGAVPAGGEAARRLRCNGSKETCDRPYNQACEVCAHNAMSSIEDGYWLPTPNQRWSFRRQLDDGVRCMMLDTYWDKNQPMLCHAYCALGETPWVPMLSNLDTWLDDHPREIVTFILESYITEAETEQALVDGGVWGRVYHHNAPPGSPWPTLRWLLEHDVRLVVFTDDPLANGDWYLDWTKYGWETPYNDPTFTCVHGRGDPSAYDNQILILNDYVLCQYGGCESNATVFNAYDFFLDHAVRCFRYDAAENPWTQIPTFINVDHYHVPAPGLESPRADPFDVKDALDAAFPTPP